MADLNQFLNKDTSASDITGGSAYGLSGSSFDQRNKKLNETRVVGAYGQSMLGRQHSSMKARTVTTDRGQVFDPSTGDTSDKATYGGNNRQANTITDNKVDRTVERRQHFVEPSPRNYDKFG